MGCIIIHQFRNNPKKCYILSTIKKEAFKMVINIDETNCTYFENSILRAKSERS